MSFTLEYKDDGTLHTVSLCLPHDDATQRVDVSDCRNRTNGGTPFVAVRVRNHYREKPVPSLSGFRPITTRGVAAHLTVEQAIALRDQLNALDLSKPTNPHLDKEVS